MSENNRERPLGKWFGISIAATQGFGIEAGDWINVSSSRTIGSLTSVFVAVDDALLLAQ
jgi:hypothetical protein